MRGKPQSRRERVLISLPSRPCDASQGRIVPIFAGGATPIVDIVVAGISHVYVMRQTIVDNALADFHPEVLATPAPAPSRGRGDSVAACDFSSERDHRHRSRSVQVRRRDLQALTVAIENLTMWTIGLTLLVGALVVVTIVRLG
jgi:hypothetical protein